MFRIAQDPIHQIIGKVLQYHRLSLGLTQEEVGGRMGISAQQIQKYEKGRNRLSVRRLLDYGIAYGLPSQELLADILDAWADYSD